MPYPADLSQQRAGAEGCSDHVPAVPDAPSGDRAERRMALGWV